MVCICIQILRLEPYLEMPKPAHAQHSGVTEETAGSAVGTGEMKVQQTTDAYGTKKDKDKVCFLFRFNKLPLLTNIFVLELCSWCGYEH